MPILLLPLLWVIAELAVMILVAGAIGAMATFAWLILAVIIGILLIRGQKISMLGQVGEIRNRGQSMEMIREGGFRVVAGLLLIVPGFLSDAIAIIFLVPALRLLLGAMLLKMLPFERFTVYRGGQVYEHETTVTPESDEDAPQQAIRGELLERDTDK